MFEAGFQPNIFILTSLIQCYGKAQRIDDVVKTFNRIFELVITPDDRFCGCLLNVMTQTPNEELSKLVIFPPPRLFVLLCFSSYSLFSLSFWSFASLSSLSFFLFSFSLFCYVSVLLLSSFSLSAPCFFSLFLPCFSVLSSLFVFVLFFILKSPPPVLFSSLYIFPHSFFFSTPLPSLSPGIYKWKTRERELLSLSSHGTGVGGWAATRQPL
jgi:pentatricopeptide repeat protein